MRGVFIVASMQSSSLLTVISVAVALVFSGCGKPASEVEPEPEVDARFSSEPSVTSEWNLFIALDHGGDPVRFDFGGNLENRGTPGDIWLTARPAHDAPESIEVMIQHDLEEVSLPYFIPDDVAEGGIAGVVAVRYSDGTSVWRGDAVDGSGDFTVVVEEASEGNYAGTFSGTMLPDTGDGAEPLTVEGRFEARK